MKVLLIHNHYQQAGGEDVVFGQERDLLLRYGHQVSTYIRDNHEINALSACRKLLLAKSAVWAKDSRREVLRLLYQEKPDVVHAHNTFVQISPSVYEACYEVGVPVVQTLHNFRLLCPSANFFRDGHPCQECLEDGLWKSVIYGCYRRSRPTTAVVALMLEFHQLRHTWTEKIDAHITLSEFSRDQFIRGGLPRDKLYVKPNFVDPDPGECNEDGEYALFVGRLSNEKGIRALLQAWARLPDRVPLRIVGDGPLRQELERESEQRGLTHIHFDGRLQKDEARGALRRARFLVLPSLCFENFPMALVEAFAFSKPVICSGFGSMREIVADGETGLHFTPGDPDDLAAKVLWAWNHPESMRAKGKAARQEYLRRYTAERNYEMLMTIYQEARNRKAVPLSVENVVKSI